MSLRFFDVSNDLYRYMLEVSVREPSVLKRLRTATSERDGAKMQTPPEVGQLLEVLVRLVGARRVLEVGVFTGYSSLCIARALPDDGLLIACDIDPEATSLAEHYWREAGVDARIDLRIAPALQTLDALLAEGAHGSFDMIFLDADKENYVTYYDKAYTLLRVGGVLLVDNVLWAGRVADLDVQDSETVGIRKLNQRLGNDHRVLHSMIPIADGLSLVLKLDPEEAMGPRDQATPHSLEPVS
ncbi:MAG: class I SAM-dependent methyltransferase [Bacteroidota bacterium]